MLTQDHLNECLGATTIDPGSYETEPLLHFFFEPIALDRNHSRAGVLRIFHLPCPMNYGTILYIYVFVRPSLANYIIHQWEEPTARNRPIHLHN